MSMADSFRHFFCSNFTIMSVNDPIIVFDGVCGLCSRAVSFIIKRDPEKKFKFIAAQSQHLSRYVTDEDCLKKIKSNETIVLITAEACFYKTDAAFMVLKQLNSPLRKLHFLLHIPKFIRDGIYAHVAKRRYKWFGRYNQCMVPDPSIMDRFL